MSHNSDIEGFERRHRRAVELLRGCVAVEVIAASYMLGVLLHWLGWWTV